jgi:hypothetical protein
VGTIRQGVDPKDEKKRAKSALIAAAAKSKTFKESAEAYIAAHSATYTSDKASFKYIKKICNNSWKRFFVI